MSTRSKRTKEELEAEQQLAEEDAKRLKKTEEETLALVTAQAVADATAELEDVKPPPVPVLVPTNLDPNDVGNFDQFLFFLLLFRAQNNNFSVGKDDQPNLYAWIQFIKKQYKNYVNVEETSLLSDAQVKVLEFLHVPLTSRGDDHWNRFYEHLKTYKERHKHVLVPRLCEIPGLGDWVTDQRRQYKAMKQGQTSQLTPLRLEKLEALGFVWQVRNRPEWDNRYNELLEYKSKHGDCKVPQHYKENRALGKWVAKQREQYKLLQKGAHSFLTPYRLEKLEAAGFVWQVRSSLDSNIHAKVLADASERLEIAKAESHKVEASVKEVVEKQGALYKSEEV